MASSAHREDPRNNGSCRLACARLWYTAHMCSIAYAPDTQTHIAAGTFKDHKIIQAVSSERVCVCVHVSVSRERASSGLVE